MSGRKRRKISKRGFETPWSVAEQLLRSNLGNEFQAFAIVRVTCGPSFTALPSGVSRRLAMKLVKLQWLRWDRIGKRWYQRKTSDIFEFIKGQDTVFIPEEWSRIDGSAVLFNILNSVYTKFHPTAAASTQKPERTELNHRKGHFGGMALTEVKRITGMSVGKAWTLRRRCEALGLCFFTNRHESTTYDSAFHGKVINEDPRHLFDGYRRPMARLTSKFNPTQVVEFRKPRRGKISRHTVTEPSISNYCSGNSKACYF
jgi:hypothetical protein